MKLTRAIACLLFVLVSATATAREFKIVVEATGQEPVEVMLDIEGDQATTTTAGEVEKFNLKDMTWLHDETNQWVPLAKCKAWAEDSREKAKTSKAQAPPAVRAFLAWLLNLTFEVENEGGKLQLTSGQVDYVVEGVAAKSDLDAYYRYAELNAYKKALVLRKLPPFAELAAIAEMKKLGHVPAKITVTMPGVPDGPTVTMTVSEVNP